MKIKGFLQKQNAKRESKKKKGFSLAELLLAIAIFTLVASELIALSTSAFSSLKFARVLSQGVYTTRKVFSELQVVKQNKWSNITNLTDTGPKHLNYSGGTYQVVDGEVTLDDYTYSFTVSKAFRDASGNLVSTGGIEDQHSRLIRTTLKWKNAVGQDASYITSQYLNDWNTKFNIKTSQTDFQPGTHNNTLATNDAGGEVKLGTVLYADWCRPSLHKTTYDLPGQGVATAISANPGDLNIATGGNASGMAYISGSVTPTVPPVVSINGTFDGYKVNDVFADYQYVYLATDSNSKEVVILQKNGSSITEVGYFNTPANESGNSVFVKDNYGYVLTDSKLYKFDLTSKTGSRPQIGSAVNVYVTGRKLIIVDNYAYIAMDNILFQLMIVDLSNLSITGLAHVNWRYVQGMYINSTATRAYLVTNSSSSKEFYIVDITNKNGFPPTIASYDTNGMNAVGITVVANNTRAILVGNGGTEQYQVLDISNENAISKCGGLTLNAPINAVSSVTDTIGNVYSYILTGISNQELQLIRGGLGGGIGNGYGYPPSGDYTFPVFDSGSASSRFLYFDTHTVVPAGSTLRYQLRTGTTPDLSSQPWVGPDGTTSTFYIAGSATNPIFKSNIDQRYIQFKAYYTSDTVTTAELDDITIYYE